jgi:ABC-2 type transport system ATP-binding protein
MDMKDTFFDTAYDRSKSPLPESDYAPSGNVRKVRKRVLSKLLKYEFKAIVKPLIVVWAILFALSALLFFLGFSVQDPSSDTESGMEMAWIIAFLPYLYAVGAALVAPIIVTSKRYTSHFFGKEGYLTFSIPASAEEHLLAKRLSALALMAISAVAVVISLAIAGVTFGVRSGLGLELQTLVEEIFFLAEGAGETGNLVWLIVEGVISGIFGTVALFCLCGAGCCWKHRGMKKWMIFLFALVVYGVLALSQNISVNLLQSGIYDLYSGAAVHITAWLQILFNVGVAVFSTMYELRTLQKKLNLK